MTAPIQFPVFVRLKDCGDVVSFSSIGAMAYEFEKIDVENAEYEAWDSQARPLRMFVKQTPDWVGLEPADHSEPEQLRSAILEFARIQRVDLGDSLARSQNFAQLLETVTLAVRTRQQNESWWQKLKRRF